MAVVLVARAAGPLSGQRPDNLNVGWARSSRGVDLTPLARGAVLEKMRRRLRHRPLRAHRRPQPSGGAAGRDSRARPSLGRHLGDVVAAAPPSTATERVELGASSVDDLRPRRIRRGHRSRASSRVTGRRWVGVVPARSTPGRVRNQRQSTGAPAARGSSRRRLRLRPAGPCTWCQRDTCLEHVGARELAAFYVGTGVRLMGEEVFTILHFLAILWFLTRRGSPAGRHPRRLGGHGRLVRGRAPVDVRLERRPRDHRHRRRAPRAHPGLHPHEEPLGQLRRARPQRLVPSPCRRSDRRCTLDYGHAAAATQRDDRGPPLLGHRSPSKHAYPDVWDLPGGVVEDGESETEALTRELHEELGVRITTGSTSHLCRVVAGPAGEPVLLSAWLVTELAGDAGQPRTRRTPRHRWFGLTELPPLAHHLVRESLLRAARSAAPHD